jgi:hypothetical protein
LFSKEPPDRQTRALARSLDGLKPRDAQQFLDELAGRMNAAHVRDPVRYCARLVERFRRGEFELELGRAVAKQRRYNEHRDVRPHAHPSANQAQFDRAPADLPPHIREALERMRRSSNGHQTGAGSKTNPEQIRDPSDGSD